MKIAIKKKSIEQIIKEEMENILLEAESGKTHNRYVVKKQRNGKVYPGIQYLWDTRTKGILQSLDKLKEAESGSWYQTDSADAEDYEEAFQEFLTAKGNWEFLVKFVKKKQKQYARKSPDFAKWNFQENYGISVANVKEEYPNYIKKITVEETKLIIGGINPTIFFSDGSKKQFKTPKRPLTAANAARGAWSNSFLYFNGSQLEWRYKGSSEGLFSTELPIGGPWKATSGTLDVADGSLTRLVNLVNGRGWTGKDSKELQKLKGFGPIPEGTYIVPAPGRMLESVPKKFQKDPSLFNNIYYMMQYSRTKMNTGDKKAEIGKSIAHGWNPGKEQSVWQSVAWGNHRIALGNNAKIKGKKISNLAQVFGRGGFYIHGGTVPGSSGCIDLGEDMDKFAEFWTANFIATGGRGGSIPFVVKYDSRDFAAIAAAVGKSITTVLTGGESEDATTGNIKDYDISKFKISGCSGASPISSKARNLGATDEKVYEILGQKLPKEILDMYPNWNVGKPGNKTIKIVAHFQAFYFKGDKAQIDGCIGPGTWKALTS
jgi:hypothetical protein